MIETDCMKEGQMFLVVLVCLRLQSHARDRGKLLLSLGMLWRCTAFKRGLKSAHTFPLTLANSHRIWLKCQSPHFPHAGR